MTSHFVSPLIEANELAEIIDQANVKVIDASWYLPSDQRYPLAEYEVAHIPGAKFFDIDAVCDTQSAFPHMLPCADDFAQAMSNLGVSHNDLVVVYDGSGVFSAPRLWWTLRVFGHDNVRVLNGGLPAWQAVGGAVASLYGDAPSAVQSEFTSHYRAELVYDADAVLMDLESQRIQLLDARTQARFNGEQEEHRPGVRSGHIPGSINLPFKELLDAQGKMRPPAELKQCLCDVGVDLDKAIVTSCGSGITASVLALALFCIGRQDVPVYDGSWAEWGAVEKYPVATNTP